MCELAGGYVIVATEKTLIVLVFYRALCKVSLGFVEA